MNVSLRLLGSGVAGRMRAGRAERRFVAAVMTVAVREKGAKDWRAGEGPKRKKEEALLVPSGSTHHPTGLNFTDFIFTTLWMTFVSYNRT